jgi:type VI secretion system protein ImpA
MSVVDIDFLLQEVDSAAPCGPNLEYDAGFLELEQAVLGKPEVQYGDTITPAVPPEWKQVRKLASDLLGRARDLRLAVPLARALLALDGVPGFADGLRLIERLLVERWDSVHPQLDPDDDLDPTLRLNSLASLADSATVLRELKESAFVTLPGLGPLSLRVLDIASGELAAPDGEERLSQASLEAALGDVAPQRVQQAHDAFARAHDSVTGIEVLLVRRVGSAQALNLDALSKQLRRARDFLATRGAPAPAQAVAEAPPMPAGAPGAAAAASAAAAPPAISGDVASRADVLRMLDRICAYYARSEPSSPVPLLLERARRLVPKNFFEIMEDLVPDGIAQLTVISGPREQKQQDGQ